MGLEFKDSAFLSDEVRFTHALHTFICQTLTERFFYMRNKDQIE